MSRYTDQIESLKKKRQDCYGPDNFRKEFDALLQTLPVFNEYVMFAGRTLYVSDLLSNKINRALLIKDIQEESYRKIIFPSRAYGRLTFWIPVSLMFSRYGLSRSKISIECEYEFYEFPNNIESLWDIEDALEALANSKEYKLRDFSRLTSEIKTLEDIIKSEHYAELKRKREEKKRKEREKRETLERIEQERAKRIEDRKTLLTLLEALSDKEFERVVVPEYIKRLKEKLI